MSIYSISFISQELYTLENLRKQIRFIENSKSIILSDFENLYNSFRESENIVIDGMKELGEFHDSEATRLVYRKIDINNDTWFIGFSNLMGEAHLSLRTKDDSVTDFYKLEIKIVPTFIEFFKNNIKDPRTPIVASIFNKTITSIFQRKETIKNLIKIVNFYVSKYQEARQLIILTIGFYLGKSNINHE